MSKLKEKPVKVEINAQFARANDITVTSSGAALMFTPPLNEAYWMYRVRLKHGQAIVVFPKFGTIGCGFAKEEDWNTNLPLGCATLEIFNHIKHNKKYKDIKNKDCIAAIEAIKLAAKGQYRDQ